MKTRLVQYIYERAEFYGVVVQFSGGVISKWVMKGREKEEKGILGRSILMHYNMT